MASLLLLTSKVMGVCKFYFFLNLRDVQTIIETSYVHYCVNMDDVPPLSPWLFSKTCKTMEHCMRGVYVHVYV